MINSACGQFDSLSVALTANSACVHCECCIHKFNCDCGQCDVAFIKVNCDCGQCDVAFIKVNCD